MGSFDNLQRPSWEITGQDCVSFDKRLFEGWEKIDALEFDAHLVNGWVLFDHCFYKEPVHAGSYLLWETHFMPWVMVRMQKKLTS